MIITKDACTQTSNSSYNYVTTDIVHDFYEKYTVSDFLTSLNSIKSEQISNYDVKIKTLEKQVRALIEKSKNLKDGITAQLKTIEILFDNKETYPNTFNHNEKKKDRIKNNHCTRNEVFH